MIPRIAHRVWLDEEIPEVFEGYWTRLQELNPGWEFRTWNDSGELDWLQNRELFESFEPGKPASYALRADVLRYEVLARFGGVYVDTDVEPLRGFAELLEDPRPFIGWCSDQELDPAVIASPPGHPAICQLVDDLEPLRAWLSQHRGAVSPPGTTGPHYVTARWRMRPDVRRLPPVAFFPYHWSRMADRAKGYPDQSYAVHHWAAGWKRPAGAVRQPPALKGAKLSVLVAFRDVDGERTKLWEAIRSKFAQELPEAEIVVASDDGTDPFHKTLAINRAAHQATGDIFAIWDADSWCDPQVVRQSAAFVAANPARWSRPWQMKLKLNAEATSHLLGAAAWDTTFDHRPFGRAENRNTYWPAPPLLLARSAFEAIGGMDERFRGWGGEDLAFALALNALVGRPRSFAGVCIHLHHPRLRYSGNDLWVGQDSVSNNRQLLSRYQAASRPERMRALLEYATQ